MSPSVPALSSWNGQDRRNTQKPPEPLFAQLLLESEWLPSEDAPTEGEGWFRANGHAPDRRAGRAE